MSLVTFKEFAAEVIPSSGIMHDSSPQQLDEVLITLGKRAYPRAGHAVILAGGAGCYPKGTEFFTGEGWKAIEDYEQGDKVLQFDIETGNTSLTDPLEFVNLPVDQFYRIRNRRVDFVTSKDHNHLTVNEKTGKMETIHTHELVTQHETKVRENKRKLVTSFQYDGPGIPLSDDEIRLKVAVFADGYVLPTSEPKIRVSLKKERKIERLRMLLEENGIDYREYLSGEFTGFEFKYDSKDKEFGNEWYSCTNDQLKTVCDEALKWDGSIVEREGRKTINSFHSASKQSAEFIQFAFTATGHDVSVNEDVREGRDVCYGVYVNHSSGVGISKNPRSETSTTEISAVDSADGRMYCFQVPTGFFVVRQNGKILVSGNSGKGFVISNLLGIEGKIVDVDKIKELVLKSPKVIAKIKEETGHDVSKMSMKNPSNVSKLHEIIGDIFGWDNKREQFLFASILANEKKDKPNVIFDTTLSTIAKLARIAQQISELGYDSRNVHIVWVVNDFMVAMEQNRNRERVVLDEILLSTHEGASLTMRKVVDMGEDIQKYMNGEIVLVFNKVKVDSALITRAENNQPTRSELEWIAKNKKGKYVTRANYVRIKESGKLIDEKKLDNVLIAKIKEYVPKTKTW